MHKRIRKLWSVQNELLIKAREAMLCSVQIFNNPQVIFKSESFIVLSNISWTYLLHSYYKKHNIDYRHSDLVVKRKKYYKTKNGSYKYWGLETCLDYKDCPIDEVTKSNLKFLIGLRHEIEHQMTTKIDDLLSARFQACCLNFNSYVKKLFGEDFGIDKYLSFSLQFSSISEDHKNQLTNFEGLPKNIASYISDYDNSVSEIEYNDPRYSYRVLYVPKTVNNKGQADRVIEFIPADSPEAQGLNKEYRIIRDREKPKFLPGEVVKIMNSKGFKNFKAHKHTEIWKLYDAKNPINNFGVQVSKTWYWYESWIKVVEKYCNENISLYK